MVMLSGLRYEKVVRNSLEKKIKMLPVVGAVDGAVGFGVGLSGRYVGTKEGIGVGLSNS